MSIREEQIENPPDGYFFIGELACLSCGDDCGMTYDYFLHVSLKKYRATSDNGRLIGHDIPIDKAKRTNDDLRKLLDDAILKYSDPSISPNSK